MRWRVLLLLLCCPLLAWAKERTVTLKVPVPQGKFPPEWTRSIHVSLVDSEDSVVDHRYWKKGDGNFEAILKGHLRNQPYEVELLCLSKGEKKIGVFRQKIRIDAKCKSLNLDKVKFVEFLDNP